MAICSEADAFIAASLTQFSMTARLAFMVVGPMVDVKLIALQTGTFGGRFAVRFAPLTFVVVRRLEHRRRLVVVLSLAGGTISLIVGAAMLRLSLTHTYERYVRVGMGPFLTLSGVAVIVLGLLTLVYALRRAGRPAPHDDDHDHDHDEHEGVGVGWLLLAPIAALLLVRPSDARKLRVDRGASVDVRAGAPVFPRIPRRRRSARDESARVRPAGVRPRRRELQRFACAADGLRRRRSTDGGFRLARYQIACCAADATAMVVRVVGTAGSLPVRDEWVTVTGRFKPGGTETPELTATNVAQIAAPEDPYE